MLAMWMVSKKEIPVGKSIPNCDAENCQDIVKGPLGGNIGCYVVRISICMIFSSGSKGRTLNGLWLGVNH
jgi:hypothetical protein